MEEKRVGIEVQKKWAWREFTTDSVAKTLRSVMLEEEGKTYRFGDKELHQNYVDEFVDNLEIHRPTIKD